MATQENGAWSETALVTITKKGGSDVQYACLIETIDIDLGEKGFDSIANLCGGRIIKKNPQEVITITFEAYPILTGAGKGFSEMFNGLETWDTTEPLLVYSSKRRDLFRVAILLSTGTETSAVSASTASNTAMRFVLANAYCTKYTPSFTDGILKASVEFKATPFNRTGVAQWYEDSTDGTTALTALNSFNTTNFPVDGTAFTW